MTWVLWTLVPMVHTPRGRSGTTFVRVLAQSECGQFCHFGICGPNWDCHHVRWHGDLFDFDIPALDLTSFEWTYVLPYARINFPPVLPSICLRDMGKTK